jgi:5-methylcytosine-specific restriction protein B
MNEPIPERDALWDEFLARWPLEELPDMQMDEYTRAGDKDCFTYWLEARTEGLGSIWGGSAFKFGIYGRKDQSQKSSGEGVSYTTDFAWATKYGAKPDEAFVNVRKEIMQVANAAHRGDLAAVEAADLGPVTKWKIAFLYQDRQRPKIINIFKIDHLQALGSPGQQLPASKLHPLLAAQAAGKHILAYADELWAKIQEAEAAHLSTADALKFLRESGRFTAIKPATEKMAGFRASNGRELALARDNKRPTLYLSAGPWLARVSDVLAAVDQYPSSKSRSSNLAANAPSLTQGNAIVKVTVATQAALTTLCDAYEDLEAAEEPEQPPLRLHAAVAAEVDIPLNQILYGPPGTGKTFRTVEEALRIVDPAFLRAHLADRAAQKRRFDEHVRSETIRFITFHQSFSYEDFVEGIRAVPEDEEAANAKGGPRFVVDDGIFKLICDAADVHVTKRAEAPPSLEGRTIWKMSLGNSETEPAIYEECIENGYALLGYGSQIDFSGVRSAADVLARYREAGRDVDASDYAVKSVATFLLNVQPGHLLVVTDGNFKFRAIGEIVGPYEHAPHSDTEGYAQRRRVKWLRVYKPSLPFTRIMGKQFVQRTLYELKDGGALDKAKVADLLAADLPVATRAGEDSGPTPPKVLIIDEINRGNVSRVFGELITLVEASKRKGMPEALEVVLPYSKKPFSVPKNVYLIGTMNTADRSLTGLDIALRRRFSFVEVPPQPELLDEIVVEDIGIGDLLRVINARIEVLLDRDHRIGHTYFMPLKGDASLPLLATIFRRQILPLLEEYFFEDWSRIRLVLNDHRKKDGQTCFIKPAGLSVEALFGQGDDLPLQNDRWTVNDEAFKFADSYRGIIHA